MISVIIPTFRRPESLLRAARSVFAQVIDENFELIVVDNDPDASAYEALRLLETEATIPFRWTPEPQAGVASARNAALQLAEGELIAWLDDDEEAPTHWLAALMRVRRETGADCVFGPVRAEAPVGAPHRRHVERLYSRTGPAESGRIDQNFGVGNSLMRRATMVANVTPFDLRANETGGEDDLLFARARRAGATFAWAADAVVTEHVDANRARLSHMLRRAFAYGQGPCETAWAEHDYLALARHMSVGAAQALIFGAAAGAATLARRDNVSWMDRAARGAGKVMWFRTQHFYGAALTRV